VTPFYISVRLWDTDSESYVQKRDNGQIVILTVIPVDNQ